MEKLLHNNSDTNSLKDEKHFKFLSLKNKIVKKCHYTCHHCKYQGPRQFLMECSTVNAKSKGLDNEVFKELIFIKNSLDLKCKKYFCLNCLLKNYHYSPDEDPKKYVCPFCSGTCYCLNCER